MLYATVEDLLDLFPPEELVELTNLDHPTATAINEIRLKKAIEYASQEVDSYLGVRYLLPLTSIPLVLRNKVADIARYHLDSYRARDDVRQRYEDAVQWLKLLAKGEVQLGLDTVTQKEIEPSGSPQYYAPPTVMGLGQTYKNHAGYYPNFRYFQD